MGMSSKGLIVLSRIWMDGNEKIDKGNSEQRVSYYQLAFGWFNEWINHSLISWFIYWFIDWLIYWFIDWFIDWLS